MTKQEIELVEKVVSGVPMKTPKQIKSPQSIEKGPQQLKLELKPGVVSDSSGSSGIAAPRPKPSGPSEATKVKQKKNNLLMFN